MKVYLYFIFGFLAFQMPDKCLNKPPTRGPYIQQWEQKSLLFNIRAVEYLEKGAIVNGAYYDFQVMQGGSSEWKPIMSFRHDEDVEVMLKQIRFIDKNTAFVFMGWKYAVTTDAGVTWSVWDATHKLQPQHCCHYQLIEDIQIEPDGNGILWLNKDIATLFGTEKLSTKDFGRSWNK